MSSAEASRQATRSAALQPSVRALAGRARTCHGASLLCDAGLLLVHDVHDDAALQHLGQTHLDGECALARLGRHGCCRSGKAVTVWLAGKCTAVHFSAEGTAFSRRTRALVTPLPVRGA